MSSVECDLALIHLLSCHPCIFLIILTSLRYQLIQFILQVKGTQFLSGGVLTALMGAGLYFRCVNLSGPPAGGGGHIHTCDTNGACGQSFMRCCVLPAVSTLPAHLGRV